MSKPGFLTGASSLVYQADPSLWWACCSPLIQHPPAHQGFGLVPLHLTAEKQLSDTELNLPLGLWQVTLPGCRAPPVKASQSPARWCPSCTNTIPRATTSVQICPTWLLGGSLKISRILSDKQATGTSSSPKVRDHSRQPSCLTSVRHHPSLLHRNDCG